MKTISTIFLSAILFACSPKYTELNDHGFGGGFKSKNEISNNQSLQKEQSLVYKDEKSSNNICDLDKTNKKVLHLMRKPQNNHKFMVIRGQNSFLQNKYLGIQKKPLDSCLKSKFTMPNGQTSIWKWFLFVIGSLLSIFGLIVYLYGISRSMLGWEVFYIYGGLAFLLLGLLLLIIVGYSARGGAPAH